MKNPTYYFKRILVLVIEKIDFIIVVLGASRHVWKQVILQFDYFWNDVYV